ncbi:hypothetical protein [Rhodoblastus sp.]|jgi:hypothetical protein|nr:hypothetical protein [Rhodoblastus sp.]
MTASVRVPVAAGCRSAARSLVSRVYIAELVGESGFQPHAIPLGQR